MKTIQIISINKRGIEKKFSVSAIPTSGNFYSLKINADFEIDEAVNGHAAVLDSGIARNYTLENFKLKPNSSSQIVVTPKAGSKKDRFTISFDNNNLIQKKGVCLRLTYNQLTNAQRTN